MLLLRLARLCAICTTYIKGHRAAAAAEFAIILPILAIPILNVVDLGVYAYDRMQLDNAAQVGAQAAAQAVWGTCTPAGYGPFGYYSCSALVSASTTAANSTSLGSVWQSTSEQYCCPGSTSTSPVTCSGAVTATSTPPSCTYEDYVLVTAKYDYSPIFSAISVASLLTTPITRTAYMRLD